MSWPEGSVQLTGPIGTTDITDVFPTHQDFLGFAGFRSVEDLTALNAITTERRAFGMLVGVQGTNPMDVYVLANASMGGVDNNVSNNANWILWSSGGGGEGDGGGAIYIDQSPDDGTYGPIDGLINGSNTLFTVSKDSYLSGKMAVFLNGIVLLQGASDEWQEVDPELGTFTLTTAPNPGEILTVIYLKSLTTTANFEAGVNVTITGEGSEEDPYIINAAGYGGGQTFMEQTPDNGTYQQIIGTINGTNKVFQVSKESYISGYLAVFLNGVFQKNGVGDEWHELDPATGTFEFETAPNPGEIISVMYTTVLSTSGNFIAGDGIEITGDGSVDDPYVITATATSLQKETPTGLVNDVNVTFNVANEPFYINVNGGIYEEGDGIYLSYSAGVITLAAPVGTGGFIKSYYQ